MDVTTLGTYVTLAVTGYGEVVEGRPTWAQREMHTYTNLVRVDPMSWAAEYGCATTAFTSAERTAKAPLRYHDGLTEIAQLHSEDMAAHNFLDHSSWDGTSFSARVWPYYSGVTIGENVAAGYVNNAAAVWQGWMCSAGHRANIMSASFTDIGCGVERTWYTQDFGGGAGGAQPQLAMGVHVPERPVSTVEFLATYDGDVPTWLGVETRGACVEASLIAGSERRGGWAAQAAVEEGCVPYRFVWVTSDAQIHALPDSGAYQYGSGCELWIAEAPTGCDENSDLLDTGPGDSAEDCAADDRNCDGLPDRALDDTPEDCGCSGAGASGLWLGLLVALGLRRRKR